MVIAMRGTPETIINRALEDLEGFSDILSAPPLLWTRRPFSENKNIIQILSSYDLKVIQGLHSNSKEFDGNKMFSTIGIFAFTN